MISNLLPVEGKTDEYVETNGLVSIRVYKSSIAEGWRALVSINGSYVYHTMIVDKDEEVSRVKAYELALAFTERINEYCYEFQEE